MNIPAPIHTTNDTSTALTHPSAALPPLRSVPATTVDIAIVGGTVAGLAAAIAAAEAGARVLVLEATSALRGHEAVARLAERARKAGVTLAGEARILHYEEEHGCANTMHWRLDAEGGIAIPARGLIVAYDEQRPARADSGVAAAHRLGAVAPGLVLDGAPQHDIPAATAAGSTAGAELARLVLSGSGPSGVK